MSRKIGGLFGRSAYGPLHELAVKVRQCVQAVGPLVDAWASGARQPSMDAAAAIDRLEGAADTIKNEIRANLTASIFSSTESARIKDVVHHLDSVAYMARLAARHVEVRRTPMPGDLGRGIQDLAAQVAGAFGQTVDILDRMRAATDATDREALARAARKLEAVTRSLDRTDEAHEKVLAALFAREAEMDPVSVIFVMRVIEAIEGMAKCADNAAEALRRLAAE